MTQTKAAVCQQCGTEIAPQTIECPVCGRLVHADRLRVLADTAKSATAAGDLPSALTAWREALTLLPRDSKQFDIISARITELGRNAPAGSSAAAPETKTTGSRAGIVGAIALLLLKLKTLLFGLSQASTFFSMMLSLGVYWTIWGWKFALGIVLSIYVHEMGHVIRLRALGFKSTAPMFIPGVGALIRLQQQVVNPEEDAEIGLAGPIYGLGAAAFAAVLWAIFRLPIFVAIAGVGAWINLFNLVPVGTLDGGRGFHAMNRWQKIICTLVMAAGAYFTHDGLQTLIAIVCGYRALTDKPYPAAKPKAMVVYASLTIALTALSMMRSYVPR